MSKEEFDPENMADFLIPQEELEKLSDFSNGGYVLFAISANNDVIVYSSIENQVVDFAIETAIKKYIESPSKSPMEYNEDQLDEEA